MVDVPTVFGDEGAFSRFTKGNVTEAMQAQEIECPHCKDKKTAKERALFSGVPVLGEYMEVLCPNCDKSFGLRWENDSWVNFTMKV